MATHDVVEPFRWEELAHQIAAGFRAGAGRLTDGWRRPSQPPFGRPVVDSLQPGHIAADADGAGLDTVVAFARLGGRSHRCDGVIQEQPHVFVRGFLIALQGQHEVRRLLLHPTFARAGSDGAIGGQCIASAVTMIPARDSSCIITTTGYVKECPMLPV